MWTSRRKKNRRSVFSWWENNDELYFVCFWKVYQLMNGWKYCQRWRLSVEMIHEAKKAYWYYALLKLSSRKTMLRLHIIWLWFRSTLNTMMTVQDVGKTIQSFENKIFPLTDVFRKIFALTPHYYMSLPIRLGTLMDQLVLSAFWNCYSSSVWDIWVLSEYLSSESSSSSTNRCLRQQPEFVASSRGPSGNLFPKNDLLFLNRINIITENESEIWNVIFGITLWR